MSGHYIYVVYTHNTTEESEDRTLSRNTDVISPATKNGHDCCKHSSIPIFYNLY